MSGFGMNRRSSRRVERGASVLVTALATAATAVMLSGCIPFLIGTAATGANIAHDSRTTGTFIEDQAIELKAAQAISTDPALKDGVHVNVTSYNEIVLLSGEARTDEQRKKVVELVRRIEKVKLVHNEIAVAEPSTLAQRSSDTYIGVKVKTNLFTLESFDPTRVKVVTERGIVYLMGLLSREEGTRVAEVARRVSGVQKVVKLFEYSR